MRLQAWPVLPFLKLFLSGAAAREAPAVVYVPPADAEKAPSEEGPCRYEYVMSYNNGYFGWRISAVGR